MPKVAQARWACTQATQERWSTTTATIIHRAGAERYSRFYALCRKCQDSTNRCNCTRCRCQRNVVTAYANHQYIVTSYVIADESVLRSQAITSFVKRRCLHGSVDHGILWLLLLLLLLLLLFEQIIHPVRHICNRYRWIQNIFVHANGWAGVGEPVLIIEAGIPSSPN